LNKKILDDVYPGINISPPTLGYSRRTAKERLTPRYVSAKPPVLGQDLNDQRYVLVPAAPIRKTAYPGYLLDSLLFWSAHQIQCALPQSTSHTPACRL